MDGQLLLRIYHQLFDPGKLRCPPGCIFSDSLIVLIQLLGVLSGRSPRWACQKQHWPLWMRRMGAPSYSQFIRRLKSPSVLELIQEVNAQARAGLPQSKEKFCDGKPLSVGGFSKDPDTREGRLPGDGWGRGYKLHVIVDACGAVELFCISALNGGEPTHMALLVKQAASTGLFAEVTLRGDSAYDSNPLYAAVSEAGGRLIATRKRPGTGLGHSTKHHPDRLRAIAELEASDEAGRAHRRLRILVEQVLGHMTNLPFGLTPLPNFVRRLRRVQLWVLSKITLYHLYLNLRAQQNLAA